MDAVAFIRPISLKSEMSGPHQLSSWSLDGMENPMRPRTNLSTISSSSDLNKPLPSPPMQGKLKKRTSSIYSTDINDLIDSYLSSGSISSRDSVESPRYDQCQHLPYIQDTSRFYPEGRHPVSESHIPIAAVCDDHASLHDQLSRNEATQRYSNPEPRSPEILDLRTHGLWDDEGLDFEKSIKEYRDTLLPTPYTPISIKSPGLCHDVVPLRGPRSAKLSRRENSLHDYSRQRIPFTSPERSINRSSARSSMADTHVSDRSVSQKSDQAILRDEFSHNDHITIYSEVSDRGRLPSLYSGSTNSSSPRLHIAKVPRPAPLPYPNRQHLTSRPDSIRSSSLSDLSTQPSIQQDLNATLPRNWSPTLKSSNPAIPRVPRYVRSPAIGLSEYQIVGSRAWKADKHDECKQSAIPFWAKRNGARCSTSKQQSFSLDDDGRQSYNIGLYSPTQKNISNVSSPPEYIPSNSSHPISTMNLSRHSDPVLAMNQVELPTKRNNLPPSKLNFSRLNPRQASKETSKSIPWLKTRKQKASFEEGKSWSEGMKDTMATISAPENGGLLIGGSVSNHVEDLSSPIPTSQEAVDDHWI